MKTTLKWVALMILILSLLPIQTSFAEPSEIVKGVYDALVAEDSQYVSNKQWYTDATFEETLTDDGFTITVNGDEYSSGSWTFTLDGDYLTTTVASDDYNGLIYAQLVMMAVGDYYGMDTTLLTAYIGGLDAMGLENRYFITQQDESTGEITIRIYAASAYDMSELDQMVINENSLPYGALGEDTNMVAQCGKLMIVVNGSANYATILLGEYGGLDDLAYQSIINAMNILQPKGWENFVANYTELVDAKTDGYDVTVNASKEAAQEAFEGVRDGDQWVIIHIGDESMEN